MVVCAIAPAPSNSLATSLTRDACAPSAAYTHRTPVPFCAMMDVNPRSDNPVPGSPLTSMHCPRPIGANKSTALIPVTNGVVMGLRSSTLGGSRINVDESSVPDTIASPVTNSPNASTIFPNVDVALGPHKNSVLLASAVSPRTASASRLTRLLPVASSVSNINAKLFGSR